MCVWGYSACPAACERVSLTGNFPAAPPSIPPWNLPPSNRHLCADVCACVCVESSETRRISDLYSSQHFLSPFSSPTFPFRSLSLSVACRTCTYVGQLPQVLYGLYRCPLDCLYGSCSTARRLKHTVWGFICKSMTPVDTCDVLRSEPPWLNIALTLRLSSGFLRRKSNERPINSLVRRWQVGVGKTEWVRFAPCIPLCSTHIHGLLNKRFASVASWGHLCTSWRICIAIRHTTPPPITKSWVVYLRYERPKCLSWHFIDWPGPIQSFSCLVSWEIAFNCK